MTKLGTEFRHGKFIIFTTESPKLDYYNMTCKEKNVNFHECAFSDVLAGVKWSVNVSYSETLIIFLI